MIDLHTHVLPGVDDGVDDLDEAVDLVRAAAAEGVTTLAATPHVRDDYPTDAGTMERLVDEVREAVQRAGIAVEVVRGGELSLDHAERMSVAELARFGLAGGRAILLEFPYQGWPLSLAPLTWRLLMHGFRPVIAHPERNPTVQSNAQRLGEIVAAGTLVQVTSASLAGAFGRPSQNCALDLIEQRLAHLVASDAHGVRIRRYSIARGLDVLAHEALVDWLARDVPRAVVAGTELPPRPEGWERPRFFGRLLRR